MKDDPSNPNDKVVSFRSGKPLPPSQPVEDLSKYQQADETSEDYRHRMLVNGIAFVFVIGLIGAGIWLADTMASMKKNQDCVLSGRRGCTPVNVDAR